MSAVPGVKTLTADVQTVSGDECDVIKLFVPYWTRNRETGRSASIGVRKTSEWLLEGDPLILDFRTPPYESYVAVDYYLLDGSVIHLPPGLKGGRAPANHAATIGSQGEWVVAKPLGSELIVLLTTPAPLFDAARSQFESKADYLRAVEERLDQIKSQYGPERIAADFVQITTRPRAPAAARR